MQRNIIRQFRFNKEENEMLKRKAQICCLSDSALVRLLVLGFQPKPKPDKEFYDALRYLSSMSNSLHQLSAKANALHFIDVPKLNKAIDSVEKLKLSLSEIAESSDEYNRTECLPSAICASYMLCEKYGIDNSDINVDSAKAMWNGKENKDVRTMLTMANDSVYFIGKDIYVQMQKNKEKAEKEPAR